MANIDNPEITGVVDQQFLLAPEGAGPTSKSYLDRFPDEVYGKAIDSHLVALVYALLGPAGIGWLRSNLYQARIDLEEFDLGGFDLDAFYGNPLKFGRILEESYDQDPQGLVSRTDWESIRAKDASYRARALDFISGTRAGGTPLGMRYAAKSGLGHEVEIFERYRWLYDQVSDEPSLATSYGFTGSTEEMVVVPRRELPTSEVQVISFTGNPTDGTINLFFPVGDQGTNQTAGIAYNAPESSVQAFLEALPSIGTGNVEVQGGPIPADLTIRFKGALANQDVPQLQVINNLISTEVVTIKVITTTNGVSSADETVRISPRDQYNLGSALSRLKPMTTIPTYGVGQGSRSAQVFNSSTSTSQLPEVIRYVTGNPAIQWPQDDAHWIRADQEVESPRGFRHLGVSYTGYHSPSEIYSYSDNALADFSYLDALNSAEYQSNHQGSFDQFQVSLFPFLTTARGTLTPDLALPGSAEPLTITTSTLTQPPIGLVNSIYPYDYESLPGVPGVSDKSQSWWSSLDRQDGAEYLEIDLGSPKPVTSISFEISSKPFDLEVAYDVLDQFPERDFNVAILDPQQASTTSFGHQRGPEWEQGLVHICTSQGNPVFTRFLRLKFQRRQDPSGAFYDPSQNASYPFSLDIRNLRIQRNVQ